VTAAVTGRTYHLRYGAVPVTTFSNQEFAVAFVLGAAIGTAVFFHAERNRIKHPSAWASFVFLFMIVGLPVYALHVRRVRRQRRA
jgi:hypothetical protein